MKNRVSTGDGAQQEKRERGDRRPNHGGLQALISQWEILHRVARGLDLGFNRIVLAAALGKRWGGGEWQEVGGKMKGDQLGGSCKNPEDK